MAHQLDAANKTQVGTSGYLLPEIRWRIWGVLIEDLNKDEVHGETEIRDPRVTHCDLFSYSIFNTQGYRWLREESQKLYDVRATSPDIQNEIDHLYLSTCTFHFAKASRLTYCLDFLGEQASSLRKITVLLHEKVKKDQFLDRYRLRSTRSPEFCHLQAQSLRHNAYRFPKTTAEF